MPTSHLDEGRTSALREVYAALCARGRYRHYGAHCTVGVVKRYLPRTAFLPSSSSSTAVGVVVTVVTVVAVVMFWRALYKSQCGPPMGSLTSKCELPRIGKFLNCRLNCQRQLRRARARVRAREERCSLTSHGSRRGSERRRYNSE